MKGLVFSFFIDYSDITGLEVQSTTADFQTALYEKPIYADATKADVIGNALYDIQIFEEVVGQNGEPGTAEGNYQSVQNVPVVDKKGNVQDVYININGRIAYSLTTGQRYPNGRATEIKSIAVSSLEIDGLSCVNVGVSPLTVGRLTQYVIDTRKAVCVKQVL